MARLDDTLDWLYSLESLGEIYKLERMDRALELIGNPHRALRAIHIAGTKGKGSVAAMLDSCLRTAGFKVGLYTKPHLVHLSERTRIGGAAIPAAQLLGYIERLRATYSRAGLALTFFEFTVALMFLYFAEAAVDIAVIETGLGGRLDSTNVVRPILSVITPIGFDHVERLGHTITAIAGEKGGIIKEGVPVVIGTREPDARTTLETIAAARRSPVRMIDREFAYRAEARAHRLDYQGRALKLEAVEIGLAGPFQLENAAIALAALETVRASAIEVSEKAIRRGMREVVWPGRFDIVSRRPLVILDCAHNVLAMQALIETLDIELGAAVRPRLVFGCLADKQWPEMVRMLAPHVRDVTLTRAKPKGLPKRPTDPADLAAAFAAAVPARVIQEPMEAVSRVMAEAAPEDVILVAGSVYLVGEVYPWFLSRQGRRELFPEAAI